MDYIITQTDWTGSKEWMKKNLISINLKDCMNFIFHTLKIGQLFLPSLWRLLVGKISIKFSINLENNSSFSYQKEMKKVAIVTFKPGFGQVNVNFLCKWDRWIK